MIIAILLVLIAIGLLLGRKATIVLICGLYAMGHWGTAAHAATKEGVLSDRVMIENLASIHFEDLRHGTLSQKKSVLFAGLKVLKARTQGALQVYAVDLLVSGKVDSTVEGIVTGRVLCKKVAGILDDGESYADHKSKYPAINGSLDELLKVCFAGAVLTTLQDTLETK